MPPLATRLRMPLRRRELVTRERLIDRLPEGSARLPRLVLLCAPAGFGKTTLLTQWVSQWQVAGPDASGPDRRRVAWLSMDGGEGDLRSFLDDLVAALRSAVPELASCSSAALDADASATTDAVLVSLLNDLDALDAPVVIAVDDYHLVESAQVHEAVAFLLDHLPAHVCLALSTRAEPPLPLARLRSRGELLELRARDLRFTRDEAQAFLGQVMGLGLDDAQLAALEARTEGWAAGLQLAALSLRDRDDPGSFIASFSGSHRFVLDYLLEEVLAGQPDDVRGFLLDTAVLGQMTGPLCDALTEGAAGTGAPRRTGQQMLEALDRANLFVVPLDDQRQWYRYHHLFADALRARLSATAPDHAAALHRAAARWHADHGNLADAFTHAVAGGDAERAADLLELALPNLRRHRRDATIRDWLGRVPEQVVRERPLLAAFTAWTRFAERDLDGVQRWLEIADRGSTPQASPTSGALGEAGRSRNEELAALPATREAFHACLAQARGDTDGTRRHARQALQLAGPQDHMSRGAAAGFLGLAAWADGDLEVALDAFGQAVTSVRASGDITDALGMSVVLAGMWGARGRPDEAARLLEQSLEEAGRHPGAGLATTGDLHVALADVLRERGDLDGACEHLGVARQLGERAGLPENRYRWSAVMAGVQRARGDLDEALALLEAAEAVYLPGFFPDVRPLPAVKARVHLAQGRLREAWDWARGRGITPDDEPLYLREYDQLTLARLLVAEQKADRVGTVHGQQALGIAERVLAAASAAGRGGSVIEANLVRALAHSGMEEAALALAALDRALEAAVPAGYARLFLDEGPPMLDLLQAAARRPGAAGRHAVAVLDAAQGHAAAQGAGGGRGRLAGGEVLSERELEVLRLLATSLSGPEIARALFVSVNTLRTHTKHIFTKLDVTTRRDAVRKAGELHLV